jgi:hypothetical protein
MPIDYIEEAEKRKVQDLQERNGDDAWGLEIGIRYFPRKEYFPPVFLHEIFNVHEQLEHIFILKGEEDPFKFLHMFEILLAGHVSDFTTQQRNLYKHWLYNNVEEDYQLLLYESWGVEWADLEIFEQEGHFVKALRYGAHVDSRLLNIQSKMRRYMKWQALKMRREGQMSTKLSKIGIVALFMKFLMDIFSGRLFLRRKDDK